MIPPLITALPFELLSKESQPGMQLPTNSAQANYTILRDCLSTPIIQRSAPKPSNAKRKRSKAGRKTAHSSSSTTSTTMSEADANGAEHQTEFVEVYRLYVRSITQAD